jgi:hypothetical protein
MCSPPSKGPVFWPFLSPRFLCTTLGKSGYAKLARSLTASILNNSLKVHCIYAVGFLAVIPHELLDADIEP